MTTTAAASTSTKRKRNQVTVIQRIKTENSVYEICEELKLARRVTGSAEPTPYTGSDGKWQTYMVVLGPEEGLSTVIVWRFRSVDGTFATTITSRVVTSNKVEAMLCPECRAGKCGNCDGTTWNEVLDQPDFCQCTDYPHQI